MSIQFKVCPKCGIVMTDQDLHPNKLLRWLKCRLCGYMEPRPPEWDEVPFNTTTHSEGSS